MSSRAGLCALILWSFAAPAVAGPVLQRPSDGCARETIAHGRRIEGTVTVDGVARRYILDVPDSVRAQRPAPLLLDFHGFGHSGAGVWEVSGFRSLAERAAFITVYPQGLNVSLRLRGKVHTLPGWEIYAADGNRDLAFVAALLDDLEQRYCIDRARVFSTGFSNGAFFSSLLACTMSARIAAVAPVGGGPLPLTCAPPRGVPILIQHGRQDDLIPAAAARTARDDWRRINGCRASPPPTVAADPACERWSTCRDGAVVEYCEEDYAHTWPKQATERVWAFLIQHPLP